VGATSVTYANALGRPRRSVLALCACQVLVKREPQMLLSSSGYSTKAFLEKKRLFLDSWVLIEWADDPQLDVLFRHLESLYSLIICTVSLLEVGFGRSGKVSANQITRAGEIYQLAFENPVDNSVLGGSNPERNAPVTRSAYNPKSPRVVCCTDASFTLN
jgi:hypothetical protein